MGSSHWILGFRRFVIAFADKLLDLLMSLSLELAPIHIPRKFNSIELADRHPIGM